MHCIFFKGKKLQRFIYGFTTELAGTTTWLIFERLWIYNHLRRHKIRQAWNRDSHSWVFLWWGPEEENLPVTPCNSRVARAERIRKNRIKDLSPTSHTSKSIIATTDQLRDRRLVESWCTNSSLLNNLYTLYNNRLQRDFRRGVLHSAENTPSPAASLWDVWIIYCLGQVSLLA